MKLLKKDDIIKAKAKDRQLEVDEGMKLARKVDVLRETQVIEEETLAKFRRETLELITKEVNERVIVKDSLNKEVEVLERRRTAALIPLAAEWDRVAQKNRNLEATENMLNHLDETLQAKDSILKEREALILIKEKRTNDMHKQTQDLLVETDILKSETARLNVQANDELQKAKRASTASLQNIEEKERFIENREKAVFSKEEELRTKEIELAKEWSVLKDREAMVERNIKRLSKQNG